MTRLFLTATVTPQPVPQKRHGALCHFTPDLEASVMTFDCASAMPAAAAATETAVLRMKSRRVKRFTEGPGSLIVELLHGGFGFGVLVAEMHGEQAVERADRVHGVERARGALRLHEDHDATRRVVARHLREAAGRNRAHDRLDGVRPHEGHAARDVDLAHPVGGPANIW